MNTIKGPKSLPVIFTMVALALLSVALYSFKGKAVVEDYYYFQFTPQPTTMPINSDYLNASNWNQLPAYDPEESESPCPDGSEFVCVLQVLQEDVDNASGTTIEDRLADHIADQPSAATYVNDPANSLTQKDRAEP